MGRVGSWRGRSGTDNEGFFTDSAKEFASYLVASERPVKVFKWRDALRCACRTSLVNGCGRVDWMIKLRDHGNS